MYRPTFGASASKPEVCTFKPKRYALVCDPPAIILEYGDDTLGLLRTRKVSEPTSLLLFDSIGRLVSLTLHYLCRSFG